MIHKSSSEHMASTALPHERSYGIRKCGRVARRRGYRQGIRIGRFIRGAKPQAGLRQTDYFEEVIKRLSLCASAGGAAFLKHYTRRSDSRPGAREARRPSGYQVAQAGLRGPSRGRAV